MKNVLNLTKIYFKETLLNLFRGSNKRGFARTLGFILLLFVAVAFGLGYTFYNVADVLNQFGFAHNVVLFGLTMALIMTLMITLTDTQGHLYKSRDYEMLSALPIGGKVIVTAKYLSSYLITALYHSIIAIPCFVVYFIFCEITFTSMICALLSLVFLPAFSQLISCIISWIINAISSRMTNKNIMRTIMSVIFCVGLSVFIYFANSDILTSALAKDPPMWMQILFAHIYFLSKAMVSSNLLYFLASAGISLVYMALSVLVISLGYKKINSSFITTKSKRSKKPLTYKQMSTGARLIRKEAVTLVNNPVYCMNSLMGPIMSVVCTIICIGVYKSISGLIDATPIMLATACFSASMCLGIAPTSSVSISMEGGKFQNLKSLPITYNQVVWSKIGFNLMLSVPASLISIILFAIFVPVGVPLMLVMIAYQLISVFSYSVLGMLMNLKFPRLKWTNETQAVKQGASLVITMLVDMVVSIIPMVLFFVLMGKIPNFSSIAYLGVVIIIDIALALTLLAVLQKVGRKLFNKISA